MIGSTIGHYHIIEKLGQGGMGVVYKARDTTLHRFVAIKILPPDRQVDDSQRQRFFHEARVASALNHSNIVVIHELLAHEGSDCIVMEYIAGRTLAQLIPRRGVPGGEVLHYATQIAS